MARQSASVEADPFAEWEQSNATTLPKVDTSGDPTELMSALPISTARYAMSALLSQPTRIISKPVVAVQRPTPAPGYSGDAMFSHEVRRRSELRRGLVVALAALVVALVALGFSLSSAQHQRPAASARASVPVVRAPVAPVAPAAPPEVKTLDVDSDLEPLTPLPTPPTKAKPVVTKKPASTRR